MKTQAPPRKTREKPTSSRRSRGEASGELVVAGTGTFLNVGFGSG
jgi:hypothetical protein